MFGKYLDRYYGLGSGYCESLRGIVDTYPAYLVSIGTYTIEVSIHLRSHQEKVYPVFCYIISRSKNSE